MPMGMRKRSQAGMSIDTLLNTICRRGHPTNEMTFFEFGDCRPISGRLPVAFASKLHHVAAQNEFTTTWVDLRADTLTFATDDSDMGQAKPIPPKRVSFCAKVNPPPASLLTSPEMKMAATKLTAVSHLAVYGDGNEPCVWLGFADERELTAWVHAIESIVNKRDGASAWNARAEAFKKLEPLVWRQVLAQSERFMAFLSFMSELDMIALSPADIRAEEQLNGWMDVRINDQTSNHTEWERAFCALQKNLLVMYESDQKALPYEIICLEYANISANRESLHAFNITTPIATIQLRGPNDTELEKWTDAVFSLQSSEDFAKLVPHGMRRQHLLSKMRNKGGQIAARMLRRASVSRSPTSYLVVKEEQTESGGNEACDLELSQILQDPKLGSMLKSFAQEHGATEELQLLSDLSAAVSTESLEPDAVQSQVSALPIAEQSKLLRLSHGVFKAAQNQPGTAPLMTSEDEQGASIIQQAYDTANRKLLADLLPRFCESEEFKTWMSQHQNEEKLELEMIAIMQEPSILDKFQLHVRGTSMANFLQASVLMEEFVLTSTSDDPNMALAERIVKEHLDTASPHAVQIASQASLMDSVRQWFGSSHDETLHDRAVLSFQDVLLNELFQIIKEPFREFQASSMYKEALSTLQKKRLHHLDFFQCFHSTDGLQALRDWMTATRSVENIDFLVEIVKFKLLDDVSTTKDVASRIYSKYINEGALAQVCLPASVVDLITQGLQPRFPSASLFDIAAEHVMDFIQTSLWQDFLNSSLASSQRIASSLGLASPPVLLTARLTGSAMRHVVRVYSSVIKIGSTQDSTIIIKENGLVKPTILRIERDKHRNGFMVSLLWTTATDRTSHTSRARSSVASSSSNGRQGVASVIVNQKPRLVMFGETFSVAEYEAMLVPTD